MRNEFYNAIRRHIEANAKRTGYGGSLIAYQVGEDEIYDASLVSLRAYRTRIHSDVVRLQSMRLKMRNSARLSILNLTIRKLLNDSVILFCSCAVWLGLKKPE